MLKVVHLFNFSRGSRYHAMISQGLHAHPEIEASFAMPFVSLGKCVRSADPHLETSLVQADYIFRSDDEHFGIADIDRFMDRNDLWRKVVYYDKKDSPTIDSHRLAVCLAYVKRSVGVGMERLPLPATQKPILPLDYGMLAEYTVEPAPAHKDLDVVYLFPPNPRIGKRRHNVFVELDKHKEQLGRCLIGWSSAGGRDGRRAIFEQPEGNPFLQYLRILKRAKIVFTAYPDLHDGDSRTWEAFASGGLVFMDATSIPTPHPFVHGEHCFVYDARHPAAIREAIATARYFLRNEEAREEIAAAGHENAVRHHAPLARINQILAWVTERTVPEPTRTSIRSTTRRVDGGVKYLFYTTYCSGRTGLSNSIMSTELGVLLADLTDRVLVLDGNISPPANLVAYGGKLTNRHRSRPTDLFEIPVPWLSAEQVDLEDCGRSMELTDRSLSESVFFYPASLDLDTEDFRRFAQGRRAAFTYGGEYRDAAVLRLSGGPEIGERRYKMHNFGFYGPLLYLDAATKYRIHHLLRRMRPQRHFVELAERASAALGAFNAVHIRRGDFKQTYGRTTLLRQPREALAVLDHNFSRRDRLVILTDERDDPFFAEIVEAYPDTVFLDHFILDELGEEFRDLPHHDSIALAFLCQLIAARARDFVGTMTSTFTSLIQRWRGSSGLDERFKFLWNELPAADAEMVRGATAISERVPMRPDGTMVEEFDGPYSWNRYNPRLNSAWMREWPESFLR